MKKVKITAIRKVQYDDLMAKYEKPIEHTCDVCEGLLSSRRRKSWISEDGKCPEGLCPEAWKTMREFVEALANGEGNFYDGWMKNRRTKQEQSQARLSFALQGGGRPIGQPIQRNDKLPLGIPKGDAFITKWRKNDGFRPVSFYIETLE